MPGRPRAAVPAAREGQRPPAGGSSRRLAAGQGGASDRFGVLRTQLADHLQGGVANEKSDGRRGLQSGPGVHPAPFGMVRQALPDTRLPSTTPPPSTYSAPAARTSSSRAGYAAVRRPLSTPAAATASGPWQRWATRATVANKRLDDPLRVRVVSDVLGCPSARDHQGDIVGGVHVGERDVRVPGVAQLLGVCVEALDEVVHHELELLLGGSGDIDSYPSSSSL